MNYLLCHFGKLKLYNSFKSHENTQLKNDTFSNIDVDELHSSPNFNLLNQYNINRLPIIKSNKSFNLSINNNLSTYSDGIIFLENYSPNNFPKNNFKMLLNENLKYKKNSSNNISYSPHSISLDKFIYNMNLSSAPSILNSLSTKKWIDRNFLKGNKNNQTKSIKRLKAYALTSYSKHRSNILDTL